MWRALEQLRSEVLNHYMSRLVTRQLRAIKVRLWRPQGRLVQRTQGASVVNDESRTDKDCERYRHPGAQPGPEKPQCLHHEHD